MIRINLKNRTQSHKVLPKSEWNIVENCHEAVKTIEEHEKAGGKLIIGVDDNKEIVGISDGKY